MKVIHFAAALIMALAANMVSAERIKDVADIQGVRENPLIGYGLVVGLDGTGEQNTYTQQTFATMLKQFGIKLPQGLKPKIKNVAAVAVHATLRPFKKPGQTIDITVSSIGSAKSLRGGTLLLTPLRGADNNVYAMAQGSLVVGGLGVEGRDGSKLTINVPTVGRIPNGATVERAVPNGLHVGDYVVFNLKRSDFTSAKRLADAVNNFVGAGTAKAVDASSVRVSAPRNPTQRVNFIAMLENLEFTTGVGPARIVINSRTGTIVMGQHVRVKPAAVTHGNLVVTVTEEEFADQPQPFADGETQRLQNTNIGVTQENARAFRMGQTVSLDDVVQAINALGMAPGDLMAILEALKQAGALDAELVVL
ncbi:MAG: flagellar biosynthesis protein FlgI [Kangiellaceae bacterium]|nr:flagellar biosynthesis protein FlgI [Kangiellaceae bacterium]|tara:strand:- start:13994 stop:15088 length:1095 start_codon:yes stop_codon:yes gene_type:complete